MFEGFELHRVDTQEATIRARIGGSGPGLLLLADAFHVAQAAQLNQVLHRCSIVPRLPLSAACHPGGWLIRPSEGSNPQ